MRGRTRSVPPRVALLAATLITTILLGFSVFSPQLETAGQSAVVIIGTTLQLVVSYATLYRPYSQLRNDHKEQLIQIVFDGLLQEYDEIVDDAPDIRVNIMTITSGFSSKLLPRRRHYLQIEYEGADYNAEEVEIQYALGEGCCGTTWRKDDPTYYDEEDRPSGEKNMSSTQQSITADVKSVLSVPVYRPDDVNGDIIAILNLDSSKHIDETKFNKKEVHRLAMRTAGLAGNVLV